MATSKRKRKKSLAHGRSVLAKKPLSTLSSKATKSVINKHHQLHKQLAKAEREGDEDKILRLHQQLSESGGLGQYQAASITGQSLTRGGDSSTVLVGWLRSRITSERFENLRLRVLEVGALSVNNAISKLPGVEMTRIDLKSQHAKIREQDFMSMPTPSTHADGFDIVSLSLVVNYVPDAEGRGDMLRRVSKFLRPALGPLEEGYHDIISRLMPALFLVLPAPCVTNSRYLTETRLRDIMEQLGYVLTERRLSAKVIYYLWQRTGHEAIHLKIQKEKVNDGKTRNNFSIVLR